MLARFCAYGFLKNQRYFEPFLLLALLDQGLSFAEIGLCIATREVCINLCEVPSGGIADVYGRRRVMVCSFLAYVASFMAFGFGVRLWHFLLAMVLQGVGDAFRSGTHKAMILDWLRQQGRAEERVEIYGRTRSWSKIGSAVSVPIGTALVLLTQDYRLVFLLSAIPSAANVINLATYPANLDRGRGGAFSLRAPAEHLWRAFRHLWPRPGFRKLVGEAMAFQGLHKSVKDYLQPLLQGVALSLPVLLHLEGESRTAILVGVVYVVLHVLSALAARRAHLFQKRFQDSESAARRLWWIVLAIFAALAVSLGSGFLTGAVLCFVALTLVQNIFRPIVVSRFSDNTEEQFAATALSIESQAAALFTALLAPLIGMAVDSARAWDAPGGAQSALGSVLGESLGLLPVALVGLIVSSSTIRFLVPRARR